MHRPKVLVAVAMAAVVGATLVTVGPARPQDSITPREATGRCDFNGDGFADLAVGAPFENARQADGRQVKDTGVVDIAYGRESFFDRGFRKANTWVLYDNSALQTFQRASRFGSSFVCGDFNGDRIADLAIGAPFFDLEGATNAGIFIVLYGYPAAAAGTVDTLGRCVDFGATTGCVANQAWAQDLGLDDRPETNDFLGYEMTWGDFDADGFDDLAVSAPGETIGDAAGAGVVHVLYGSQRGLIRKYGRDARILSQDSPGAAETANAGDNFGEFLSAVDINGDFAVDLAVGIPREDLRGKRDTGMLQTFYGKPGEGLTTDGQTVTKRDLGLRMDDDDQFGSSVAFGNFDQSEQYRDLILSGPGEEVNGREKAGAVYVLPGGPNGVRTDAAKRITRATRGIEGNPGENDLFGATILAGIFDLDGNLDLAVGVPNDDIGNAEDAGSVQVIFGNAGGLGRRDAIVHLDLPDVEGEARAGDHFGASMFVGGFGGVDLFPEILVVGAPTGDVGRATDAGWASLVLVPRSDPPVGVTITQPNIARRFFALDGYQPERLDAWGTFAVPNPAVISGPDLLEDRQAGPSYGGSVDPALVGAAPLTG